MITTYALTSVCRPAVAAGLVAVMAAGCGPATQSVRTTPSAPAEGTSTPAAAGAPAGQAPAPARAQAASTTKAKSPDGTMIAWEKTGSGPALLLVHGGGQNRKSWADRGYVEPLAKKFTVITMDLRGQGESDRPDTAEAYALDKMIEDIMAVADAAGAEKFHVWGFGHGASIVRHMAARSEDRVISAVLVGADMGPTLSGPVKDAIVAMKARWEPVMAQQKAGTLDVSKMSPGDREAWKAGVAVQAIALGALADYPALEPADIKVPTLWLMGAADESGMALAKTYDGKLAGTKVTFKAVSGLSYSDSFGRSEPILAEVEPFLASTAAPTS